MFYGHLYDLLDMWIGEFFLSTIVKIFSPIFWFILPEMDLAYVVTYRKSELHQKRFNFKEKNIFKFYIIFQNFKISYYENIFISIFCGIKLHPIISDTF